MLIETKSWVVDGLHLASIPHGILVQLKPSFRHKFDPSFFSLTKQHLILQDTLVTKGFILNISHTPAPFKSIRLHEVISGTKETTKGALMMSYKFNKILFFLVTFKEFSKNLNGQLSYVPLKMQILEEATSETEPGSVTI